MKTVNKQSLQRKTDKYVVWARELSSRGTSFWIAILGVILQAAHTSLLLYGTSAFTSEWQKITVSLGMGLFLSCALMIFTLKHKPGDKKSEFTLNLFFYFEVFIGVFYYLNKLIFSVHKESGEWPGLDNYVFLIVGLPFAYMAPYAIKQFAYVIKSDTSLEFGSIDKIPDNKELSEEEINDLKNGIISEVDDRINAKLEEFKPLEGSSEDVKKLESKLVLLDNSTRTVLKEFRKEIQENKIDTSEFIKRGSKITMKTEAGTKSVKIDTTEE